MDRVSYTTVIVGAFLSFVAYTIALVLYRLYFSPLAKFPGPKLAAATFWVEAYYELFAPSGGQFVFKYREWHEKYGPIIRINPDELHVQDSSWHETLYSPSRPVSKAEKFANRFGNPRSAFATVDHSTHRLRRSALNPFFSRRKIVEYCPSIQANMDKILARLWSEYSGNGRVLNLNKMWGCFASDTIVGFAYAPERAYNFIESENFHSALNEAMSELLEAIHWVGAFPSLGWMLQSLPDSVVVALQPAMKSVLNFHEELRSQIRHVLQAHDQGEKSGTTLFSALMEQGLPPQELMPERLHDESLSIIGAGVESIARTLSVACFHIFDQPKVRDRLVAELCDAIPDPNNVPDWDTLAKLPYLSACVDESLRLSYGASQRLPRASPGETLNYGDWVIPKNTLVSMDNYAVSHDERIFPDSFSFVPDRWLNDPRAPDGKQLSRYMVSFGKGTRSCTGMQLAYAELFITLANFFRSPIAQRARLYNTDKSDVEMASDRFAPRVKSGSQGVRIVID